MCMICLRLLFFFRCCLKCCVLFAVILLPLKLFKSLCLVSGSYYFHFVWISCAWFAFLLLLLILFICSCFVCVSSPPFECVLMLVYCLRFSFFFWGCLIAYVLVAFPLLILMLVKMCVYRLRLFFICWCCLNRCVLFAFLLLLSMLLQCLRIVCASSSFDFV